MSSLRDTLIKFMDERLESLLRVPEMWGSDESVELQVLQLLELRWLTLQPHARGELEQIQRDYIRYVREQFPQEPPESLAAILARHGRSAELPKLLGGFIAEQRQKTEDALMRFPAGGRMVDDEPSSSHPPRHFM